MLRRIDPISGYDSLLQAKDTTALRVIKHNFNKLSNLKDNKSHKIPYLDDEMDKTSSQQDEPSIITTSALQISSNKPKNL